MINVYLLLDLNATIEMEQGGFQKSQIAFIIMDGGER